MLVHQVRLPQSRVSFFANEFELSTVEDNGNLVVNFKCAASGRPFIIGHPWPHVPQDGEPERVSALLNYLQGAPTWELHLPKPALKDTHVLKGLRDSCLPNLTKAKVFVDITSMVEHSKYISSAPMQKVQLTVTGLHGMRKSLIALLPIFQIWWNTIVVSNPERFLRAGISTRHSWAWCLQGRPIICQSLRNKPYESRWVKAKGSDDEYFVSL
jgi:hypothetical protein